MFLLCLIMNCLYQILEKSNFRAPPTPIKQVLVSHILFHPLRLRHTNYIKFILRVCFFLKEKFQRIFYKLVNNKAKVNLMSLVKIAFKIVIYKIDNQWIATKSGSHKMTRN